MLLTTQTLITILILVVLIIVLFHLNKYLIKRQYKTNTKGLSYTLGETMIKDEVNLGFYNTLTKEVEWLYEMTYTHSEKNNKPLPIFTKKCYYRYGQELYNDTNLYSSIAQVQLRNQLELEIYDILTDKSL